MKYPHLEAILRALRVPDEMLRMAKEDWEEAKEARSSFLSALSYRAEQLRVNERKRWTTLRVDWGESPVKVLAMGFQRQILGEFVPPEGRRIVLKGRKADAVFVDEAADFLSPHDEEYAKRFDDEKPPRADYCWNLFRK